MPAKKGDPARRRRTTRMAAVAVAAAVVGAALTGPSAFADSDSGRHGGPRDAVQRHLDGLVSESGFPGALASVRGERPEDVSYVGAAEKLRDVWIAVRVNLRAVLEEVSLEDVVTDGLPAFVEELTSDRGAWERRQV